MERIDDTPLSAEEIATLTLFAGRTPLIMGEEFVYTIDVDPFSLQWEIKDQPEGSWYFRATVTDTEGLTSDFSMEASFECE